MKKKIGVIFGGISTEKEVSVISAKTVIDNLDKNKYDINKIFIDKDGEWYSVDSIDENNTVVNKKKIDNLIVELKQNDVLFPVLHGKYGEDGTIQGLFEMINVPYVGCGVLSSSICMDKVYTKIVLEKANIPECKYVYINCYDDKYYYYDNEFNEYELDLDTIIKKIEDNIGYPVYVKPSRSGSSIGINKAKNSKDLLECILKAKEYDNKVLIEEGIDAREIECAVLGNKDITVSCLGEIVPDEEFYSYDSKYINNKSGLLIPAKLDENISDKIREIAKKAFIAVDGTGLSRVDFFLEKNTNKIYLNEINTIPGFTSISMYPMLFKASGIEIKDLLDSLVDLALKR